MGMQGLKGYYVQLDSFKWSLSNNEVTTQWVVDKWRHKYCDIVTLIYKTTKAFPFH